MSVPMYAGACTVAIYLPYPDFNMIEYPPSDVQGFGMFGALRSYQYQIHISTNSIII